MKTAKNLSIISGDIEFLTYDGYILDTRKRDDLRIYKIVNPDPDNEDSAKLLFYEFCVEPCFIIASDGNRHEEWYMEDIDAVLSYCGILDGHNTGEQNEVNREEPIADLEGSNGIPALAAMLVNIADYHGIANFDEYPILLTRSEIKTRLGMYRHDIAHYDGSQHVFVK